MNDNTKEKKVITINNKQFVMYATSCACCKKCWQIEGHSECIYGGPYSGYTTVDVTKKL